jgi:acetoacetyl-CoA synthetase
MAVTFKNAECTRRVNSSPIFTPAAEAIEASQLTAFIQFCERATGRSICDSDKLYQLSIEDFRLFWKLFLLFSNLVWDGKAFPVCTSDNIETACFFPNIQLNYAENLLVCQTTADLERPAVTSHNASGVCEKLTRGELGRRVQAFAGLLRELHVNAGHPVVSILRNDAGSIVAALGCASVGAIFSSASAEMGIASLLSRFAQLNPLLLIVSSINMPGFGEDRLRELAQGLTSLKAIVVLDDCGLPSQFPVPIRRGSKSSLPRSESVTWRRYPFNHPLFVLFTSGTTGLPKCVIHGAGGTLLEHTKEHLLHGDLRAGDKLFFHTSTAWMMWNWQLSALASGAEIVLYDGPVVDPELLWRIVAEERVTVFGTSPPFLRMCQKAGYSPRRRELDLSALRAILSTGTILYEDQFYWTRNNVGAVPLQSISGGTDIVGCFVLGNPNLPVYAGEAQCRSFGLDVQALIRGKPSTDVAGELICAKPFPSRPLGFYGDSSGERFHAAYFAQHPEVWTHGDLIEITARAGARMHGRADGILKVRGIRIGPAEIYRVIAAFAEVQEAMVVEQSTPGEASDSRMVLLLVMNQGHSLDPRLRSRIRSTIARQASPGHVPAVIVDVPELPLTHSGKRSELAAREALNGNQVRNAGALRNPDCLQVISARVATHDASMTRATPSTGMEAGSLEEELTQMWESILRVSPIGPHDNFFETGGTSLLTAPLFQQIADRLGRRLPLSTILHAPTISSLAALLRENPNEPWGTLELLRPGETQRPLFIVPGLFGEPLGLLPLARQIETDRAVYGLRGRGLMNGEEPLDRVEEMANAHLTSLRSLQAHGPYSLLGFSMGGAVAVEIARLLMNAGECVAFLGLIDTRLTWACLGSRDRIAQAIRVPLRWPRALTLELRRTIRVFANELRGFQRSTGIPRDAQTLRVRAAGLRALKKYRPQPYGGPIIYFKASVPHPLQYDVRPLWSLVTRELTIRQVCGHHDDLMRAHVVELGRAVSAALVCAIEQLGSNDRCSELSGGRSRRILRYVNFRPDSSAKIA